MTPYPVLSLLIALSSTAGPIAAPLPVVAPLAVPNLAAPMVAEQNPAPTPSGVSATRASWSWPLTPRPVVHRLFDGPDLRWQAGHRGVDLETSISSAVLAPDAGTVSFVGVVAGRPVVSIDHGDGLRSSFEPVVASVSDGARVHRGDVIGNVSSLAAVPGIGHCAPPVCLHWGVRRGEDYVDPLALVLPSPPVLVPADGRRG